MSTTLPWFMAFDHFPVSATSSWMIGDQAMSAVTDSIANIDWGGSIGSRHSLQISYPGGYAEMTPTPGTVFTVGWAWSRGSRTSGSNATWLLFMVGGNPTLRISLTYSTGHIYVYRGGTLIGTSTPSAISAAQHYIEVAATLDDTVGAVEIRVDGVSVLSISGVDTTNEVGDVDAIRWYQPITYNPNTGYVTDLYVRDSFAFYGPIYLRHLDPTSDVSADWTPQGAGANYVEVDGEASLSTYIDDSTPSDEDIYGMEDLPADAQSVIAMVAYTLAEGPDGGAPQIEHGISDGVDTDYGTERNIGSVGNPRTQQTVFEKQPDGTSDWTVSAVNAVREHLLAV